MYFTFTFLEQMKLTTSKVDPKLLPSQTASAAKKSLTYSFNFAESIFSFNEI